MTTILGVGEQDLTSISNSALGGYARGYRRSFDTSAAWQIRGRLNMQPLDLNIYASRLCE
jgi:hypothetical protein